MILQRHDYQFFAIISHEIDRGAANPAERYHIMEASDWVNVVALTRDLKLVCVEQYRLAAQRTTLELPGGIVDDNLHPITAAKRELLEESGYVSQTWMYAGHFHPNLAFQNNLCHTFLCLDASLVGQPAPNSEESRAKLISCDSEQRGDIVSQALMLAGLVIARRALRSTPYSSIDILNALDSFIGL